MKLNTWKKLLAIMAVLIMAFAFTACGGGGDSGGSEESTEAASADSNVAVIGDYEAEITNMEIMQDYDGDNAIVITYNFTNNGEESESFSWAFTEKLFQDGVQLEYAAIFVSEDSYDTLDEDLSTEIQPGNTLEVKSTYKLNDMENPVNLELTDLYGEEKFEKEIDITQL